MDVKLLGIKNIISQVTTKRSSALLIDHLRKGLPVNLDLANCIADLLEGKLIASPKPLKKVGGAFQKMKFDMIKQLIKGAASPIDCSDWENQTVLKGALKNAGYFKNGCQEFPKTGPEITRAAKLLFGKYVGIPPSQVDEFIYPRTRTKLRVNSPKKTRKKT